MRRQVRCGQVRQVLLSVIGLLITVGLTEASPEKAKWRREILLAANDSLFASLVYSWDQPGTYYRHSDSVAFAVRRNVDGSTVLQQRLWDTVHKMDEKTNLWSSERHSIASLELGEVFTRYSLKTVPPYSHSLIGWALDEHGVYFTAVNQRNKTIVLREDLLSMEQIEARFPELTDPAFGRSPLRIAGVYSLGHNYYVLLSRGEPMDVPCYEVIFVLDPERVRNAEAKISKRLYE